MTGPLVAPSLEQVSALGDAELEACLVELERSRRVLEAAMVDVLDEADQRRLWACDGHRGVRNWLMALTNVSPAEAARRCQLMRALRDLDQLREGLRSGEIGVCQARELARVHANPRARARLVRAEERLVTAARRRSFDDFHRATTRWTAAADRLGSELSHDDTHAARHARLRVTPAGVSLSAHGGTAQGSQMLEIFAAYVDAEFRSEWEAGRRVHGDAMTAEKLERTGPQREFDALHAIFLAAARRPANDAESAVSVPTVNIVIDEDTFNEHVAHAAGGPTPAPASTDGDGDVERRSETDRGIPVDPRSAVVAALLGRVRRVVYDSAGVVIDLGRAQRLFRGSTREAVWLQGRQCLWPGCGVTAHQQDHTDEWVADQGATSTRNGGPACQRHNLWKQLGYRTWRDSDGTWHVTRPDGTSLDEPRAA
jgi:hypothetical protein